MNFISHAVRVVFIYWLHMLWGSAIAFAFAYFVYSFILEVIKAS